MNSVKGREELVRDALGYHRLALDRLQRHVRAAIIKIMYESRV